MSNLNFLAAVSMAEQIRKKKISPIELVDAHLKQIEKLNPKLNAFVHVDAERARRAAEAAEAEVISNKKLGPLHGVPISIKSSIAVAGLRCEAGTRLRAGFVSAQDAPLVARLRAAGAIVLGVTNTPEFLWRGKRTTCSMAALTIRGISNARLAARAEAKRRQLRQACPPAA